MKTFAVLLWWGFPAVKQQKKFPNHNHGYEREKKWKSNRSLQGLHDAVPHHGFKDRQEASKVRRAFAADLGVLAPEK